MSYYAKPNEQVDDTQQQKLRLHAHIWRPGGLIQVGSGAAGSGALDLACYSTDCLALTILYCFNFQAIESLAICII